MKSPRANSADYYLRLFLLTACTVLVSGQSTSAQTDLSYSASVQPGEAVFTMPVPVKPRWSWRRPETADNAQEYRMDVTIKNEGVAYTFGFYLWKHSSSRTGSGSFKDLIAAGQRSVFKRTEPGRMSILKDVSVKLTVKDNSLVISIGGTENVKHLFSGRPAEAIFKITIPEESPVSQTVPIVYRN